MRSIIVTALLCLVVAGCSPEPQETETADLGFLAKYSDTPVPDETWESLKSEEQREAEANAIRIKEEAAAARIRNQRVLEKEARERAAKAKRRELEIAAKKKRDADKPSTDQVLYAGRKFVKASLKSPSTADFGGWFGNGTGLDHGGGIYTAKMWVDSQNSFGATIRTQCWVKMRHKSGSNFDLIQLSTD